MEKQTYCKKTITEWINQ